MHTNNSKNNGSQWAVNKMNNSTTNSNKYYKML